MSDFLYFRIKATMPDVQRDYWWPLIFEGARQASFSFQSPFEQKQEGYYYSDTHETCTFQELWGVLYEKKENILVSFWPEPNGDDPFDCDISLEQHDSNQWEIEITIEDSRLPYKHAESRLFSFLHLCLSISEMCSYSSINLYWDELSAKYSLMQVKNGGRDNLDPLLFYDKMLPWKEIGSLNDCAIFIPVPFPIHVGGKEGFRYLALKNSQNSSR